MATPKLVDLKPKTGGSSSSDSFVAMVVEKAQNGWILKDMIPEGEHLVEQTFIFSDRSELLREIARRI